MPSVSSAKARRTAARLAAVQAIYGLELGQAAPRQAVIVDLERRLSQHLGTKAFIATDASGSKGKITIEFYGIDHFDGLLAKMGLK